jgi:hypothetical protein
VAGILKTVWLAHDTGQASYTIRFAERDVIAYASLSSYSFTEGIGAQVFRHRYARTWVESRATRAAGGDPDVDQRVRDTTDFLTFFLRVENASAAALGVVHDMATDAGTGLHAPDEVIGRLIYDQTGGVRGVHREARFDGGPPIDIARTDAMLRSRIGGSTAQLRIVGFDVDRFPDAARLWVDPGTGEVRVAGH